MTDNRAAEFEERFRDELNSHERKVRGCLISVLKVYDNYLQILSTLEREFCARFLKVHFEEAHRLSEIELRKEK